MISTDRLLEESKDVQILGDSRFILTCSDEVEDRPWMSESPVCPLLKHHIAHVGIFWACYPFEIVRSYQSGSYMMACFGEKEACWSMGFGSHWEPGKLVFFAAFVQNAFRCREDAPWEFCWVRLPGVAEQNRSFPRTRQCCRLMITLP